MSFFTGFEQYNHETFGYIKLPDVEIPWEDKEKYGLHDDNADKYLRVLAEEGLKNKIADYTIHPNQNSAYQARIDEELEIICKLLFSPYILLVHSLINECHVQNWLTGPGRGSCCGSLVLYLIGVTAIDPIEHNLLFERFLSATRAKTQIINGELYIDASAVPDVDMDFGQENKNKIRGYLDTLYPRRTAQICTFNTLSSKSVLKECCKIVGNFNEDESKRVSDLVEARFGQNATILKSLEDEKFKAWADRNASIIEHALQLQDLFAGKSVHASGVVLCYNEIDDTMPVELSAEGDKVVTGLSMEWATLLAIKVDLLGVKQLDIIENTCKMIGVKMEDIDIHHPSIYNFFQHHNEFFGLFQIGKGMGKQTVQKVRPASFHEVVMCISLGRPGAYKSIDDFVKFKNEGVYKEYHPSLNNILKPTGGLLTFQEQLMQIACLMGGFTKQEADGVRKACGKKIPEKMKEYKDKFIQGSIANGYTQELAEEIWQVFDDSSNYSFNLSHACGYAALTCIGAYLKANYPTEFFLSIFNMTINSAKGREEVGIIEDELKYFNIRLLPPSLLESKLAFSIEGGNIRYALASIKGISVKTFEKLSQFQTAYNNKFDVFKSAQACGLPVPIVSALIQSGCLDTVKGRGSRSLLTLEYQLFNLMTPKEHTYIDRYGEQFNYVLFDTIKYIKTQVDTKGKPLIKDTREATIKKNFEKFKAIYQQNSKAEDLASYYYERNLLGYNYSNTLLSIFSRGEPGLVSIEEVLTTPEKVEILFVANVVEKPYQSVGKESGKKYCRFTLSDETGTVTGLLFGEQLIDQVKLYNKGKLPEEGAIVFAKGIRKGDAVFVTKIYEQTHKIYTKYRELKKDMQEDDPTPI